MQNQSQNLVTQTHTIHSIHVKRETVTDTSPPPEHSIDAKYVVDDSDVYAHPSERVWNWNKAQNRPWGREYLLYQYLELTLIRLETGILFESLWLP